MGKIINKIFIFPILVYQRLIAPLLPHACVFEPTCSEYTKQAIAKYGPVKGIWLGARRISRCHPWQKEHYDPLV